MFGVVTAARRLSVRVFARNASATRTVSAHVLALLACLLAGCGESRRVAVQNVTAVAYSRSDTNDTTIWAPRASAAVRFGDSASVNAVYSMDSWTSASIDIVTAATKAVHEVRHEINVGASYEFPNVTIGSSYRYSTENDYWSHGGVASLAIDMADNNTTLAFAAFGSSDIVGRAGFPDFRRPQSSIGGRLSFTQVLGRNALIQLSWDVTQMSGFLASPYRRVAVGVDGTCAGLAKPCYPEIHPSQRLRNAPGLSLRTALGQHASTGLQYRFYFDDWDVMSHTVAPDLTFVFGEHGTLALTHRYYTQQRASFYQPRYLGAYEDYRYLTRDRKLSTLYDNQVGLTYEQGFPLGASGNTMLTAALRGSVTRVVYQAFVGLRRVDVLELTLSLGLGWR